MAEPGRKSVELILGTAQLASPYGAFQESVRGRGVKPAEFVKAAEGLGFTALDTAPAYEGSESVIGESGTFSAIHTKLNPSSTPLDSISESLRRLRRSSVEVAYFHDPEAPINLSGDEIAETAARLEGSVQVLGASVYGSDACRAALDNEAFGCIQIPAHPLKRDLLDVIGREKRPGVRVLARSVLGQGLLVASLDQIPPSLSRLAGPVADFQAACQLLDRPPLEVCLLWIRDHVLVDGLVVGAVSIVQLEQLARIWSLPPLSSDERLVIDALSLPESSYFDPRTWA